MAAGTIPYDVAVEAGLAEWRRRTADLLMTAAAIVYVPGLSLWLAGHGPTMAPPVVTLTVAAYLAVLACAVLRRVNYRTRMLALLAVGYVFSVVAVVWVPSGPFIRSLPIASAIVALVLLGVPAGRAAAAISVMILLLSPLLRTVPGLMHALAIAPVPEPSTPGVLITQGFALSATLIGLFILLGSFQRFLLQTLAAEHQFAVRLEREVAERAAAHRNLELGLIERRLLERELARISDEERRRLGQDVHDGVCQQLTGALLRCQALERSLARGGVDAADITTLSCLLEDAIDEAYSVARGLNPLEPEPGALAQALRLLAKRAQGTALTRCEFISSGDTNVADPASAQHLYRIAQEAVSNAMRHARAGRIVVELQGSENALVLRVEDDGTGLPAEVPAGGMGLRTMAYRAQAMEAALTVEAAPGGGTRVTCRVPRASGADERPRKTGPRGAVEARDGRERHGT